MSARTTSSGLMTYMAGSSSAASPQLILYVRIMKLRAAAALVRNLSPCCRRTFQRMPGLLSLSLAPAPFPQTIHLAPSESPAPPGPRSDRAVLIQDFPAVRGHSLPLPLLA